MDCVAEKAGSFCWDYIGHMRVIRFDQAQQLLACESPSEKAGTILSYSRASEIISRWTDPPARFVIYKKQIFHAEPEWLYLTRRGLREGQTRSVLELRRVGRLSISTGLMKYA